ncbi:MAG: Ppx/GppA family phosphatase [Clostridia bacterium]
MKSRYGAVIDIGTNSVRLLVASLETDKIHGIHKAVSTTRIGEGVHQSRMLDPKAMDRTLQALKEFKARATEYGAGCIFCFATSALRDAKNRELFIQRAQRETGLRIDILSGDEEAEIGFLGAAGETEEMTGVLDIGGGSTEVIIGRKGKILNSKSINIGAVRAMEQIPLGDPVDGTQIRKMREWIRRNLEGEWRSDQFSKIKAWVGIGGTITSLAAIQKGLVRYSFDAVQGCMLTKESVLAILERLIGLSLDERKRVPGLQAQRADIIIPGTLICHEWMEWAGVQAVQVSDRDNLEGYFIKKLSKNP